jgi:hypothetical protein
MTTNKYNNMDDIPPDERDQVLRQMITEYNHTLQMLGGMMIKMGAWAGIESDNMIKSGLSIQEGIFQVLLRMERILIEIHHNVANDDGVPPYFGPTDLPPEDEPWKKDYGSGDDPDGPRTNY